MLKYYIITVTILLLLLISLKNLNQTSFINKEKTSVYECGFNEFNELERKYYIKYYIIAIIFLIFDLETLLIYSISLYSDSITLFSYNIYIIVLLLIILGLIYEITYSII